MYVWVQVRMRRALGVMGAVAELPCAKRSKVDIYRTSTKSYPITQILDYSIIRIVSTSRYNPIMDPNQPLPFQLLYRKHFDVFRLRTWVFSRTLPTGHR